MLSDCKLYDNSIDTAYFGYHESCVITIIYEQKINFSHVIFI